MLSSKTVCTMSYIYIFKFSGLFSETYPFPNSLGPSTITSTDSTKQGVVYHVIALIYLKETTLFIENMQSEIVV